LPHPQRERDAAITTNPLQRILSYFIASPLLVASHTPLVVCSAMASVATGGIHLAFDLVPGHIVAAMDKFPVRPVAVFDGGFDLQFVGVAVVAE
jgi:hypothetical protein